MSYQLLFDFIISSRDFFLDVEIIGYFPTGGLGGGIKAFAMPGNVRAQFTVGRAVGADNEIHIEGVGVEPTIRVPRTEENLFSAGDTLLNIAVKTLEGK